MADDADVIVVGGGLAGLRVGYALGGPGSEDLFAELAPDLGVSDVAQSG